MSSFLDLIQEYGAILAQERVLDERKKALRAEILDELAVRKVDRWNTPYGTARRGIRFKLLPRRDAVLALLKPEDLFPFAHFTPKRVTEVLVPKFGRENLVPLFEVQKSAYLQVLKTSNALVAAGSP